MGLNLLGTGEGLGKTKHTETGMGLGQRDRPSWPSWWCPGGPKQTDLDLCRQESCNKTQ